MKTTVNIKEQGNSNNERKLMLEYSKYKIGMQPYKNAYKRKGLIFKSRPPFEQMPNRSIITNVIDHDCCTNQIKTSKYTLINFLPLNLYHQFSKVANLYFLMVGIMQMIPEISISGGVPVIFMPLSLVVTVSAIKDIFEDLKRKASDKELNNLHTRALGVDGFRQVNWQELRIGQIVKVTQNQMVPIDLILLQTSEQKRNCYIQTKNLDGQTNLKHKLVQFDLGVQFDRKNQGQLFQMQQEFQYERPNPYIHTFSGKATLQSGKTVNLDNNNIVLRGCVLKITKYIIGVAIYSGYDSKIMLNSNKSRQKKSRLEFKMGIIVVAIFVTQMLLTLLSALMAAHWSNSFLSLYDYLSSGMGFLYKNQIFTKWGSWILLFTNFVPISLIVSLQMVKFIQGIYISQFKFDTQQPSQIAVQSSNLNEQLGQIHHFFSDKTGTLTCNYMNFKYLVVKGRTYGGAQPLTQGEMNYLPQVTNVQFDDRDFMRSIYNQMDPVIFQYLLCLALCHSVIIQNSQSGIKYNASSPDQLSFVNFTKFCGVQYLGLNKDNYHVVTHAGRQYLYKQLHVIEFNSDRKRMSVIVEHEGTIILMCKGADNMMVPRLGEVGADLQATMKKLEEFSIVGLRTLLFARKEISKDFYDRWAKLYVNALTKLEVIEKEEKDRIKTEAELMKIKKKPSMFAQVKLKEIFDVKGNVNKLGSAIIQAETENIEASMETSLNAVNAKLTDNLILTDHQRIFIKEHKQSRLESHMTATELQQAIQKDMRLIGASAIEDKLQDNVKITIQSLRQAGIKVWMLTGDKRQTAINIGYSCGLIDQDMAKLVFKTDVKTTMAQRLSYNRDVCLVITGQQLLSNQGQGGDEKQLLSLVLMCKSIIACRVTPKQKQEMVALLRKNRFTTCAIGDGANDVNMINMAHVGIGIKGVEGAQAAQCSDYAISEFQMVRELMLYHGRESYRKNSRLILFNFYKNMVLVLPQFWFGMTNGFSSASMFDPWIYQLYNVVYTSLPIIIFAIFDEQYTPKQSVSRPQLYRPGLTNQNFNFIECVRWFISPALAACLLSFVTFDIFQGTVTPGGQMMFFASTGMAIFAESVIICNIKILIISHEYSVASVFSVVGSILVFYLTYYWTELIFPDSSIYNTMKHQLGWSVYYFTVLAVVALVCLVEFALTRSKRLDEKLPEPETKPMEIEMPLLHSSGN